MKRAAIYLRVSTRDQNTENQLIVLKEVIQRAGWELTEVYEDAGISGSKGRDQRPAFDRMLNDSTRRKFDIILAWSVDRLGRSLQDLVSFLNEIRGVGCDLYLHQQAIDTSTPAGKAMFQMMGVFAEFERGILIERIHAGMARARSEGKKFGRPSVPEEVEKRIKELRGSTEPAMGIHTIAKTLRVGVGTVQRVLSAEVN